MARIIVVGDGPAGLAAALFLSRNGQDVVVYAQDQTAMH
jgi:flavin-dependent dehydrogenase